MFLCRFIFTQNRVVTLYGGNDRIYHLTVHFAPNFVSIIYVAITNNNINTDISIAQRAQRNAIPKPKV